jgi:hypothetical protein
MKKYIGIAAIFAMIPALSYAEPANLYEQETEVSVNAMMPDQFPYLGVRMECEPWGTDSDSNARFLVLYSNNGRMDIALSSTDSQPATLKLRDFLYSVFPQIEQADSTPDNLTLNFLANSVELTEGDVYTASAQNDGVTVKMRHSTQQGAEYASLIADSLTVTVSAPPPGNVKDGAGSIELSISADGKTESVTLATKKGCVTRKF